VSIWNDVSLVERRLAGFESTVQPSTIETAAFANALGAASYDSRYRQTSASSSEPSSAVASLVADAAGRYGLDPALLASLVRQESGFDPAAVSNAGAMGLTQLMPETAAQLGVTDPFDAAQNVDGGARYLRGLLDRFHGDTRLAVAAYNAGPDAVERYGDVPPYAETQSYVLAVLGGRARP